MSLKDLAAPFTVWKRAFEKPYTQIKPIEERPGAERYRGFHINDTDKCIGCGTCESVCQNEAIDLVPVTERETRHGDSGLRPKIDYGRCCWCALCVDICPTSSLGMSNEYIWIDEDPEVFRFVPGEDETSWQTSDKGYRRAEGYELLEGERVPMPMLSFEESRKSFVEMVQGYSKEQAIAEADRCIACGICIATCPAHMDVPAYIDAIRRDDMEDGLRIVYQANPLPASCGRVCSHACEYVCAVKHKGEALSIRWLKRYIVDQIYLGDYRGVLESAENQNGKKVAVIGSGPGGLAAAYYLRLLGYEVRIFDANEKAGGMLRYGIPEYRLPYDQVDKDIEYIRSLGVEIHQNVRIGVDIPFREIYDDNDAVFFSTGLTDPYGLDIAGEDLPGVISGLKILDDVTDGRDPEVGKSVVVVGGGNVAMDAARTSRRYGAEVTILYRRREEDMPADEEEIHESRGEGCRLLTQAIPLRLEKGETTRLKLYWGKAEMIPDPEGGRPRPQLIEGSEEMIECDTVIPAIGQQADYAFLPEEISAKISFKRGMVQINEYRQTGDTKIFAGGDIANRKRDAISAIADGHSAAKGIDIFLTTPGKN
ncbi:FAD-dependent oxidoreductase [Marispirochaeta aestuarii]|uniref:FAD-dependent oxidoreductase n=1 Tax=Marispirochaeta aestuarii TaxID=1963862 RepID=UPI0029C8B4DD|nr:FAD-dependent oxidoreductase [Marispirochaeta aestuarii]